MKRLLLLSILTPALFLAYADCDCHCCKRKMANTASADAATKAKDPVCGMQVDTTKALKSDYKGKTYYFCNQDCKDKFDKDPSAYTKSE